MEGKERRYSRGGEKGEIIVGGEGRGERERQWKRGEKMKVGEIGEKRKR